MILPSYPHFSPSLRVPPSPGTSGVRWDGLERWHADIIRDDFMNSLSDTEAAHRSPRYVTTRRDRISIDSRDQSVLRVSAFSVGG